MGDDLLKHWWIRNPFNQLGVFAAGISLYFAVKQGFHKRVCSLKSNLIVLCATVVLLVLGVVVKAPAPKQHHIFAAAFALLGLALAALPWGLFVNRASIFVGRISYSAYLLHFLVLKQLTLIFPGAGDLWYFAMIASAGIALTLPLAYFSFRWIETPAMAAGKVLITMLNRQTAWKT